MMNSFTPKPAEVFLTTSGGYSGVAGGGPAHVSAATEYEMAAGALDQAIADLEMALGNLKARLGPVMRAEKDCEAGQNGEAVLSGSAALIKNLEIQTTRVRAMTARVDDARSRLCL